MMRGHRHIRQLRRLAVLLVAGFGLASVGCLNSAPLLAHRNDMPQIVVPPDGSVPRELQKITLPEYVIEPPDVLRIEVGIRELEYETPKDGKKDEKKPLLDKKTGKKVFTDKLRSTPLQPVWGEYAVRPDGSVYLGLYGSVPVAGLSLNQAATTIRESLAKQVFPDAGGVDADQLIVILDVVQYNSKKFYVILDGGGIGEQVVPLPVTGSETVLDALASVGGLQPVASKRNIWIARRTPHPGQPEQILPVDWVGITQHGIVTTNYQIMPGDRVYVKAQRIVTIDTTLARVISPIERILGVTLLGTSGYNQIAGRGTNFSTGATTAR